MLVLIASRNVEFALTFLVIACPGALVISTPVSMVAGLGNGARHEVLGKGGDALEKMSEIDTLVVDKTATFTAGKPRLIELHAVNDAGSSAGVAPGHRCGAGLRAADVEVIEGGGIRGAVDAHEVVVGIRKVLAALGTPLEAEFHDHAVAREQAGDTGGSASIDGPLAGIISIADRIRPEAAAALAAL